MIEISNVSKRYGQFQALNGCSAKIHRGEVVVVCGPSGSGKSTLIKCINGLESIDSGTIDIDGDRLGASGTDMSRLRARVGMVFQNFELFPHLTILRNLTLAQEKVLKRNADQSQAKARALLDRVGLSAHIDKFPAQLSGGQQQRVAIARALVTDPTLIVADEPTGNLDAKSATDVLSILQALSRDSHKTVIMVTHDPKAAGYGTRSLHLEKGEIVA